MRKASTSTGLRTTVNVINRIDQTGRNATEEMKEYIRSTVCFETLLPNWTYTLTPQIRQYFLERY